MRLRGIILLLLIFLSSGCVDSDYEGSTSKPSSTTPQVNYEDLNMDYYTWAIEINKQYLPIIEGAVDDVKRLRREETTAQKERRDPKNYMTDFGKEEMEFLEDISGARITSTIGLTDVPGYSSNVKSLESKYSNKKIKWVGEVKDVYSSGSSVYISLDMLDKRLVNRSGENLSKKLMSGNLDMEMSTTGGMLGVNLDQESRFGLDSDISLDATSLSTTAYGLSKGQFIEFEGILTTSNIRCGEHSSGLRVGGYSAYSRRGTMFEKYGCYVSRLKPTSIRRVNIEEVAHLEKTVNESEEVFNETEEEDSRIKWISDEAIDYTDATKYIGEVKTVEGQIKNVEDFYKKTYSGGKTYTSRQAGELSFLDYGYASKDSPYIEIPFNKKYLFTLSPEELKDKEIRVTGEIMMLDDGSLKMVATEPSQIEVAYEGTLEANEEWGTIIIKSNLEKSKYTIFVPEDNWYDLDFDSIDGKIYWSSWITENGKVYGQIAQNSSTGIIKGAQRGEYGIRWSVHWEMKFDYSEPSPDFEEKVLVPDSKGSLKSKNITFYGEYLPKTS